MMMSISFKWIRRAGRTAMDLAAQNGQVSFLQLFEVHNGIFKFKNAESIAKNRESESQAYLRLYTSNSTQ